MTVSRIDNGALKCIEDDGPHLGFPTGISTRRFSSADTVSIRNSEGIIIESSGDVRTWPIERFIDLDGEMVAVGPWIEGCKPFESEPLSPEVIDRLLPVIRILESLNFPLEGFDSRAVRWLPGGGVLLFPPKLTALMAELSQDSQVWVHPDRKGMDSWSFSLGVMAWRALTDSDPFAGERGESRRERIRSGILPPMTALIPGISEEAESFIRRALTKSENKIPTLDEWESFIKRWQQEGVISSLSDTEFQQIKARAMGKAAGIEKKLKIRRWMRKSGWKLLTGIAVTAGVLAFASAPIRKALEAPVTAGMSAMEVAETYYNAINEMDAETMDDCLGKKAGKDDLRMVNAIYVTAKMRQGYEGITPPPMAEEWIKNGKPELPDGLWPWGISNLKLKQLSEEQIEARYLLWVPPEGGTEASRSVSRTDILSFIQARRSLEISDIQRTTED